MKILDLVQLVLILYFSVIYHEKLEEVPKILETPYVDKVYPPYRYEIEMIRNKNLILIY